MFVCDLAQGVSKEGCAFTFLSICVVVDDEVVEIDREFFKNNRAAIPLIELSKKRSGKNFEYVCEMITEKSKKNTDYTYLSIRVPLGDKLVEVCRHFFSGEASVGLIEVSENQYPVDNN